MGRTAAEWSAPPKFPATHYVDSRLYTDEAIFKEEKEKLFRPSWISACHEAGLPGGRDYCRFTHRSGVPRIVGACHTAMGPAVAQDCPARGTTALHRPSATAERMTRTCQ